MVDIRKSGETDEEQELDISEEEGVIGYIYDKFEDAENGRFSDEQRWLDAYKNYRGIYDSTTQYRDNERSQVFVKITKTKVLAAYGQIIDILFANNKFPISVQATPMPEGIDKFAHLSQVPVQEGTPTDVGFEGDGMELLPGATQATPMQQQQQGPQRGRWEEGRRWDGCGGGLGRVVGSLRWKCGKAGTRLWKAWGEATLGIGRSCGTPENRTGGWLAGLAGWLVSWLAG